MAASHSFQVLIKRTEESSPHSFSEQNTLCSLVRVVVDAKRRALSRAGNVNVILPSLPGDRASFWQVQGNNVISVWGMLSRKPILGSWKIAPHSVLIMRFSFHLTKWKAMHIQQFCSDGGIVRVFKLLLITHAKSSNQEPCFKDHNISCGTFNVRCLETPSWTWAHLSIYWTCHFIVQCTGSLICLYKWKALLFCHCLLGMLELACCKDGITFN